MGCGDDGGDGAAKLVDPARNPPVNSLDVDPRSGAILLSTNRGLFRIERGSQRALRMRSEVEAGPDRGTTGRFLTFAANGSSGLLGSGHPNGGNDLPPYLGLMASRDGGRSWSVLSRLGLADLHVIRPAHGRVYALDAVLDGLLVGDPRGRRWSELRTPRPRMLDLEVDPGDGDYLLASDKESIYRSEDRGRNWRPIARGRSPRLAWPPGGPVYRADSDRRVLVSSDRGVSWKLASLLDGEPWRLKALGAKRLLAALGDGSVLETTDGGREWKDRFRP